MKKKISNEELSALVRELAYNIYYELLKLQSKQNPTDVRKRLLKLSNPSGKAPDHELPNWEVLKYYTEARDALQTYNITKERKYLDLARCSGLKAASVDPYYNNPLYLLYNVGIAYINNFKNPDYYEAERIARYVVALRPDSPRVWYSWGVALSFLTFNKEAIDCFEKALFFDNYETEKGNKIAKDIYFMMAISLRDLKHYDESIRYFLKYLSEKEGKKNGYAWGHYGITLEAKAKLLDKYVFRWNKIPGDPGIDEKISKIF